MDTWKSILESISGMWSRVGDKLSASKYGRWLVAGVKGRKHDGAILALPPARYLKGQDDTVSQSGPPFAVVLIESKERA